MDKKTLARSMREQGHTCGEIAKVIGTSRQYVHQICGKQDVKHFQYITDSCVYPNLRKWMNDNQVSRSEFVRRMGLAPVAGNKNRFSVLLCGVIEPRKTDIDRMIKVTGLPYEVLFASDGVNTNGS